MKNAQRLNGRADQTYEIRMFKYMTNLYPHHLQTFPTLHMTKDFTLVETDWIAYLEKLPVVKSISKPKNNVQPKDCLPIQGAISLATNQFNIPNTFPPTLWSL